MSALRTVVVGAGRAGGAFSLALASCGWDVTVAHHDTLSEHAELLSTAELVLLCVPDSAVGQMADAVRTDSDVLNPERVVAHCAGSLGLVVLGAHPRVASIHPLVALADPVTGAQRLHGAWFAIAGDPAVRTVVDALDGTPVEVDEDHRAAYHAAAGVASNHLVALLGQVQRIATTAGVPLAAYLDLAAGSVDNVVEVGPKAALTGPVSRGDWDTVRRHLAAIDASERDGYLAMVEAAARLAARELPPLDDG